MSSSATLERFVDASELRARMLKDVRAGFSSRPWTLPPKYFYDERGSELFVRITRLQEYYPTRCETEILESLGDELLAALRPDELVEIGSGSSRKTRLLLEAMHAAGGDRYVPFDTSEDAVRAAMSSLRADYPWLTVHGVVGDFDRDLQRIPVGGRRLVAFLGSTIGNLTPAEQPAFLRKLGRLMGPADRLLIGFDLVKETSVLEAAYDDAKGVTAEFNRNVLHVINRELGADFRPERFAHVARYDEGLARIEMWLRAEADGPVRIPAIDLTLDIQRGDQILTEISCKFTRATVERVFAASGLVLEDWHLDSSQSFALAVGKLESGGRSASAGTRLG